MEETRITQDCSTLTFVLPGSAGSTHRQVQASLISEIETKPARSKTRAVTYRKGLCNAVNRGDNIEGRQRKGKWFSEQGRLLPLSTFATQETARGEKQTKRGNPLCLRCLTQTALLATAAFVPFFFLKKKEKEVSPGASSAPRWGSLEREFSCSDTDRRNHRKISTANGSSFVLTYPPIPSPHSQVLLSLAFVSDKDIC